MKTPRSREKSRAIANATNEHLLDLDRQTLNQYFAWVEGGRFTFNVRRRDVTALPLAARSALPELAWHSSMDLPDGYIVCESLELRTADSALAPISILTDTLRHDVFLLLASSEGVAAGIASPRALVHKDAHYPLHPLDDQEMLFQVMGLSLDDFKRWHDHDAYLETDPSHLAPEP